MVLLHVAKEHLNVVFIGHVDAGKSTMGGQLLYLTGGVLPRTMEKYEREAKDAGRETWYLSWALDSTPQERSQVRLWLNHSPLWSVLPQFLRRVKQSKSVEHSSKLVPDDTLFSMLRATNPSSPP